MPTAGSSSSIAFHAAGTYAHSPATDSTATGFSASAAQTGFGRARCSNTSGNTASPAAPAASTTYCVGTTTGISRLPGATRCPNAVRRTAGGRRDLHVEEVEQPGTPAVAGTAVHHRLATTERRRDRRDLRHERRPRRQRVLRLDDVVVPRGVVGLRVAVGLRVRRARE